VEEQLLKQSENCFIANKKTSSNGMRNKYQLFVKTKINICIEAICSFLIITECYPQKIEDKNPLL
jgi:hypothetical protein